MPHKNTVFLIEIISIMGHRTKPCASGGFDSPFFAPSLALKSLSGGLGKVPKFFNSLRITNPNALNKTTFGFTDKVPGSFYRTGRGPMIDFATQRPALNPYNTTNFSKAGKWTTGIGLSGLSSYYYYKKLHK